MAVSPFGGICPLRIRQLIDQESPAQFFLTIAIVARLKAINIDIARRTVAKYRGDSNLLRGRRRRS